MGDAILIVPHLINQMLSRGLHLETPLECLKEFYPATWRIPDIPLQVFGCIAFVCNYDPNQTKFAPRAHPFFLGYP